MLILDTIVLSTFTYLGLVEQLQQLDMNYVITPDVLEEFSKKWVKTEIPSWINIDVPTNIIKTESLSISTTDTSLISLAIEKKSMIATDDLALRKVAKNRGIAVVGTLGLLKLLYTQNIIHTKETYMNYLEKLRTDLYLSDDLVEWAIKDID
jgi:predicted nucleic acid-binding protein